MATTAGSLEATLPPHAENLGRAILDRLAATPNKVAFMGPGSDDSWSVKYTWAQAGDEMLKLGAGLIAIGVELEDRVAIASSTRTEWIFADAAVTARRGDGSDSGLFHSVAQALGFGDVEFTPTPVRDALEDIRTQLVGQHGNLGKVRRLPQSLDTYGKVAHDVASSNALLCTT